MLCLRCPEGYIIVDIPFPFFTLFDILFAFLLYLIFYTSNKA